MTEQPERKGGGGMVVLALLVLLLAGGGAYYYFKMYKQPVAASALPVAATPTPQTAKAVTPTGYNSVTEQSYIDQADAAFLASQQPKKQAFEDARKAYIDAGSATPKGLTTKETVVARRNLIAKFIAADDDYAAFAANQEAMYKGELAKTPLTPGDIEETFRGYVEKAKTPDFIKIREAQHAMLKSADDMMAALEKGSGNWSVSPVGKLSFKRPADGNEYNALAAKYNVNVQALNQLQSAYAGTTGVDGAAPSASATPASGANPTTAATPAAAATP